MTFVEAAKIVIEENGNKPMTSREIWCVIESRSLVNTKGKTPQISLNASMLYDAVGSRIKSQVVPNRNIFVIVGRNPIKFQLSNYMPKHIKDNLTKNGFITIETLKEIFKKNNIDIKL